VEQFIPPASVIVAEKRMLEPSEVMSTASLPSNTVGLCKMISTPSSTGATVSAVGAGLGTDVLGLVLCVSTVATATANNNNCSVVTVSLAH
jgi:hypothetical protein